MLAVRSPALRREVYVFFGSIACGPGLGSPTAIGERLLRDFATSEISRPMQPLSLGELTETQQLTASQDWHSDCVTSVMARRFSTNERKEHHAQ
jgi:hypothetical protein